MSEPSRARLLELVDRFESVRVLAVVDLIADEYVYGNISRVSREAPVLILAYDSTEIVPGGGANAVYNTKALGGKPLPIGIVGKDPAGKALLSAFRKARIDVSGIDVLGGYRTPSKTRILAGGVHSTKQQVLRIDRQGRLALSESARAAIERRVLERMGEADVAMVSDYGLGLVTPELGKAVACRAEAVGKLSVADSRYALLSYEGFASATPNEPEAEAALGLAIGDELFRLERAGRTLLRRLASRAIVITRGSKGMALFEAKKPTRHIPIFGSDEVADVTGAGDTVISTFTLALGAGASFYEAALLANYAGGIVVMKRGTATVSPEELASAVRADRRD